MQQTSKPVWSQTNKQTTRSLHHVLCSLHRKLFSYPHNKVADTNHAILWGGGGELQCSSPKSGFRCRTNSLHRKCGGLGMLFTVERRILLLISTLTLWGSHRLWSSLLLTQNHVAAPYSNAESEHGLSLTSLWCHCRKQATAADLLGAYRSFLYHPHTVSSLQSHACATPHSGASQTESVCSRLWILVSRCLPGYMRKTTTSFLEV